MSWDDMLNMTSQEYRCGHCGFWVASCQGYNGPYGTSEEVHFSQRIYICTNCNKPTYFIFYPEFEELIQNPAVSFGNNVENLPNEIKNLYEEARRCTSNCCYTAAVMLCRKLLMHIAVENGATEDLKFVEYVKYLNQGRLFPRGSKNWVDHILTQGNEANHEIAPKGKSDAELLIGFMEILLKIIYDLPTRVP